MEIFSVQLTAIHPRYSSRSRSRVPTLDYAGDLEAWVTCHSRISVSRSGRLCLRNKHPPDPESRATLDISWDTLIRRTLV